MTVKDILKEMHIDVHFITDVNMNIVAVEFISTHATTDTYYLIKRDDNKQYSADEAIDEAVCILLRSYMANIAKEA